MGQNGLICRWCQTEIVWDPETGPEEQCPHCFNELSEYRSITFGLEQDEEDEEDEEDVGVPGHEGDDLDEPKGGDLLDFEEGVEQYLDAQEDVVDCAGCREPMVYTGTVKTDPGSYTPHIPAHLDRSFLQAPFAQKVFVCPNCFRLDYYLDDESRLDILGIRKK